MTMKSIRYILLPALASMVAFSALAAEVCEVATPMASISVPHVRHSPELNTDPHSATWKHASSAWIIADCTTKSLDYPNLKTEVRAFWTDTDLYLLFVSPYTVLNLWPADPTKDHLKLWDRDVVEFFLGDDFTDIKHYREFEIAPTGDWVDLAIDLNKEKYEASWDSGWQRQGRIDEAKKVWYAAAKVPLKSVSEHAVKPGTKWRGNLYRIDGLGEDPQRHFMCWQPTCAANRDPNHVPEHFGTLIFTK